MFDTAPHPIGHRYWFLGIEVTVVNFEPSTEWTDPIWIIEGPGGWTGHAFEDELTFVS